MGLLLNTGPTVEPLTTAEGRDHLRITALDENTLIDAYISAARLAVENYTNRALINQTWEYWLDEFPRRPGYQEPWWDGVRQASSSILNAAKREIEIPKAPLSSITSIVTYNDSDTASTFSSDYYIVSTSGNFGRAVLKTGQTWPTDLRPADAVKITFVAGYGAAASSVPQDLRTAVRLLMAWYYEHRGDDADKVMQVAEHGQIPMAVQVLIDPYRVVKL